MQPFRLAQGELLRTWREALEGPKRDEAGRP
jgi:hypothetical protein